MNKKHDLQFPLYRLFSYLCNDMKKFAFTLLALSFCLGIKAQADLATRYMDSLSVLKQKIEQEKIYTTLTGVAQDKDKDGRYYRLFIPMTYKYYHSDLGFDRPMCVYTPAGYNPAEKTKYPVLYLIHGMTDTYETWWKVGRVNVILDNLIARVMVPR